MKHFPLAAPAALFAFLISVPSQAAPDNTSGMALMSATVRGDGTLIVGSGVTSVEHPSTGNYLIHFDRSLENCTCTASFGGHGVSYGNTAQSFISSNCPFVTLGDPPTRAQVSTYVSGALSDFFTFQMIVFCPK